MKKRMIIACVSPAVAGLFYVYQPDKSELNLQDLDLPTCSIKDEVFETQVTFFVDSNADKHFVYKQIDDSIAYSNLVLNNSCLPLHRSLVSIEDVKLNLSGSESFDEIHSLLKVNTKTGMIDDMKNDPYSLYVLILSRYYWMFDDGIMGATDVELSDSFVVLSDDATPYILEHEFGHLAWAQHLETVPFALLGGQLERATSIKNRHKLKDYARAYKCANAGTIMSYEDIRLPIYSSPLISYKGQICGDDKKANNLKVVQDYVSTLISKDSNEEE